MGGAVIFMRFTKQGGGGGRETPRVCMADSSRRPSTELSRGDGTRTMGLRHWRGELAEAEPLQGFGYPRAARSLSCRPLYFVWIIPK
jgi:hypothetical protein